jgi:hypothetical protein
MRKPVRDNSGMKSIIQAGLLRSFRQTTAMPSINWQWLPSGREALKPINEAHTSNE